MSPPAGWPGRLLLLTSLAGLALGGGVRTGVALIAAVLSLLPAPPVAPAAWLGGHAGVLTVAGVLSAQGRTEEGLAVLVSWLAVHRQWVARTASDGRIGVLFSTLLVLLGALATESIPFGICLATWVVLLPLALLRIELGAAGGARAAVVSVVCAALTVGLYVILPRLQGGYLAAGSGTSVPDTVTLGDDFGNTSDQAIVARLRIHDRRDRAVTTPVHVRGRALDAFSGSRWTSSFPPEPTRAADPASADLVAELELEPMEGGVIFGVPEIIAVRGLVGGTRVDANGSWFHRGPASRLRYTVFARTEPRADVVPLTDDQALAYLMLPTVEQRVAALAFEIAPGEQDPRRIAQGMTDWLSGNLEWVESPPVPVGDPLADFLFVRKTGHCEYFASALTVMLRLRGVPARLVTGFWTGEVDDDGRTLIVRRGQAHAWVEVPLSSGWTTFDPSPLAGRPTLPANTLAALLSRTIDRWNRWVVEYNFDRQVDALADLGRAGAGLTGQATPSAPAWAGLRWVVMGVGSVYVAAIVAQLWAGRILIPGRRSRRDPLVALVDAARDRARRLGWAIPDGLPPLAAADWLVAEAGPAAEPFRDLCGSCTGPGTAATPPRRWSRGGKRWGG